VRVSVYFLNTTESCVYVCSLAVIYDFDQIIKL